MAKIKYSALVSDMRNKLNGSVLSKNRYGSIIRNKVTPVNPQSSFQQNARQSFSNLSSSFRELTALQIESWNLGAQNFPFTDIFGDTKHLSGQTLFVKLNANLEKAGSPRILTAPSPVGFPEINITDLEIDLDGDALDNMSFTVEPGTLPAGYAMIVYATQSLPRSRSFVKNQFRMLGVATVTGGAANITALYNDRFPTPLGDEVVHVRAALISLSTGQQGIPLQLDGVVSGTP